MRSTSLVLVPLAALALGCERREEPTPSVGTERADRPLRSATAALRERFAEGDALFEATMRPADGLGPLFIRASCASCHRDDGRGPGRVGKVGFAPGSAAPLPFGATLRPYTAAGARTPILPPPQDGRVRVTYRLPPAVFARGYLEAVDGAEIERMARVAAQRPGAVRGRLHRVFEEGKPAIGRFGLKARLATLTSFTADALQGDMGLTSPLRPNEPPNPDGLLDDEKAGIDLSADEVEALADYMRLLELPPRRPATPRETDLFDDVGCATCHVPVLRTRDDYPVRALAGIGAPLFTDLLLHDMGEALSDGVSEGDAGPREWRTAPLVGLRFVAGYMHDGRARTVEEAIEAHAGPGSEANEIVARFRALSPDSRRALITYVEGL